MSTDRFEYINKHWFLELVMRNNADISDVVKKDLAVVDSIDEQILSLVKQRNYVLYGLNCKCLKSRNASNILGANPLKVWKAYKQNGFNDQLVKDTVSSIRAIFFDDSQDKFHKLFCTQVKHQEYGCDDIAFIFEDEAGHSMQLTFDIKQYEDDYLYKNKLVNGYIYFGMKKGRDYYTIERSVDINDIRTAIEKWIDDDFKAENYKFEHGTLLENAAMIFSDFEKMRAYDCYCTVKEAEDQETSDDITF